MASVLSTRQCAIAALVVLLMLLAGLPSPLNPARAQSAPAISLDPTEGPPGTVVTIQGSGWVPGDTVILWFAVNLEADGSSTESTVWYDIGQTTVGDDGTFVSTFTVPAEATDSGAQGVSVDTSEASEQAVAFFQVVPEQGETPPPDAEPTATLDPTEGPPGTEVTVTGSGWPPGDIIDVRWDTTLAQTTADDNGNIQVSFFAPADATEGEHDVFIRDGEPGKGGIDVHLPFRVTTPGDSGLVANAGPDQTVPGPSPVNVQFDGSGSTGDIVRYQWYNQYGLLLAEEVTPVIEVNFGKDNPQPGTQRTFTLVVEDSQGNTAEDQVTITLGETPEEEKTPPPEAQPTIALDPMEGLPGTEVTATGSGWIAGETVIIQFAISRFGDNLIFAEVAQPTVGDDGSFAATFTVPAEAAIGEQKVIAGTAVVSQQTDAAFQVTGELAVTVDQALTLNPDGQEKTTFRPGDGIWYAVIVRNSGPPVDVEFTWQGKHADPEIGTEIYSFTNTFTLGREFYATVYSPATIPTDAPVGPYLNRETVTVGGQEFVRESQFEVVSQETPTSTPAPTPTPTPTPPTPTPTSAPPATPTATPAPTPSPTPQPNQSPVITLVGENPLYVVQGCPFSDPKATATDAEDGDLTNSIVVEGSVNINAPGPYLLTYKVKDSGGLWAVKTRQVIVFGVISSNYPCVYAKPEGRAPNLVVIVHGCCTDAHDVYSLKKKFSDAIGRAFSQNPPSEQWEIVVWDWHEHTPKRGFPLSDEILQDPLAARENIRKHSEVYLSLKDAIANNHYKHVHLIGHSTGAQLIQLTADELVRIYNQIPNIEERPFIHLTFLDAFTLSDYDKDTYGSMLYNYQNYYAEHYVDRGLRFREISTDECLSNAFNFDVTGWIGADKGDLLVFGHWWPVYWYIQSITTRGFRYGFPLSFEGGNDQFKKLDESYPPGEQSPLVDEKTKSEPAACW